MKRRALLLMAMLTIVSVACDSDNVTTTIEPDATSTTGNPRVLAPTQTAHDVGAVFQSGRFLITVGEVVHDSATGTLHLGLRFANLTDMWVAAEATGVIIIGSTEHHIFLDSVARIPPTGEADIPGRVQVGEINPVPEALLRWGAQGESQTTIRLIDGSVEGFGPPLDVDFDSWGQIGRFGIHITGGRIYADSIRSVRTDGNHLVLRVEFDEYANFYAPVNGFHGVDHLILVWPDGTRVDPIGGTPGRGVLSWTSAMGNSVDFPIPLNPEGTYQVLLASIGRFDFRLLHPDLVERTEIPITIGPIGSRTSVGPLHMTDMPRPDLKDRVRAEPVDLTLNREVNLSGFIFRATHLTWDPTTAVVSVEGEVRLVPPVRPPTDDILSFPSQFGPYVALRSGSHFYEGLLNSVATVTQETPVPVGIQFPFVESFDPETATLFLGHDAMTPATLALGQDSIYQTQPVTPDELPVTAPPITAGNYTVQVVGYRFGLPREFDRPPAGWRSLEVIVDVTAKQVEEPGPFGLGFDTRAQLFFHNPDGYLKQADNYEWVEFADGETVRLGATYYVPATWTPGIWPMTVRSIDEVRYITRNDWLEVTFNVEFHAPEPPEEARLIEYAF